MISVDDEKAARILKTDPGFLDLIRPLYKNEYLQLKSELLTEGCREPIAVWNGVIVGGYERYKLCMEYDIPFRTAEMDFTYREEAVSWICTSQLKRPSLTEESRKYLIGTLFLAERGIARRRAIVRETQDDPESLPYETYRPDSVKENIEPKKSTASQIGETYHISNGTVEKYSLYSRAIDEIRRKAPQMSNEILSGGYKISHEGVVSLSGRSAEEIIALNKRLEHSKRPYAQYQTTRQEIQGFESVPSRNKARQQSVKDMPEFDPDAEVTGLTLTIPSWAGSIERIARTNLGIVSETARIKLQSALTELQDCIGSMLSKIEEDL